MSVSKNVTVVTLEDSDYLDHAFQWGHEDATEGRDQRGSTYFAMFSPAWVSYNDGFLAGAQMLYSVTGTVRHVWIPEVTA